MSNALVNNQDLDALVLRYKDMVYRLALVRVGNPADADDIFQDVFYQLIKHAASFREEEHLKAWLLRVTINCCNKHYRDSYRKRTVPFADHNARYNSEDMRSNSGYESEQRQPQQIYCERSISLSGGDDTVLQAVQSLPDNYRDVIHLFYYEDCSIRKIAQILRITEAAVKTRLTRARKQLGVTLKDVDL